MSLVTIGGNGFLIPHLFGACRRDIHGGGITIDAAGEKAGFVFRVPRTGTIDRVGFTTRAVTTSQTLRVGLETTDTTNYLPTDTQYGGSAVGTQASPVADTFYEVTLATPATATKGDIIAIVIQFDSTVGNLVIGKIDNEGGSALTSFPYVVVYTTSWAKDSSVGMHSVRYSDGVYEPIGQNVPTSPRIDTFFNTGSAADEIGNRFTVPAPMRTPGIFSGVNHISAAIDYVLYEESTVLSTISVAAGLSASGSGYETLYWDSPITLSAGTVYRLVAKPTSGSSINVREAVMLNNAMLGMIPGGLDWYKTSRADGGSWTDTNTRRIWALSLLIDQIDDAVSAGGGVGPRILTPVGGGGAYF